MTHSDSSCDLSTVVRAGSAWVSHAVTPARCWPPLLLTGILTASPEQVATLPVPEL